MSFTLIDEIKPEKESRFTLIDEVEPKKTSRFTLIDEIKPEKESRFTLIDEVEPKKTSRFTLINLNDSTGSPSPVGSTNKPIRLAKSFGSGMVQSLKDTYTFFKNKNKSITGALNESLPDWGQLKPKEDIIAKGLDKALEATEVADPSFDEKVAAGFGSALTYVLPGKKLSTLSKIPRVAKVLGVSASALLESSANAGGTYDQALSMGKSEDEALRDSNQTFYANLPVNYILGRYIFNKIPEGKKITSLIKGSGQEAGQEYIQTIISNVSVDDEISKDSFRGAGESALIGGIVGGGIGGVKVAAQAISDKQSRITYLDEETIETPTPSEEKATSFKDFSQKIGKQSKKIGEKYFTSEGLLPKEVHSRLIQQSGEYKAEIKQAEFNLADYKRKIKKLKLSEQEARDVGLVLKGEAKLPDRIKVLEPNIKAMRGHIDTLSNQLIESGAVEGDVVDTIKKHTNSYVTRAYQIHTDPNWGKKIPNKVREAAKTLLRTEYTKGIFEFYNERESLGVGKAEDFNITRDSKKIQKFKEGFLQKLENTSRSLDRINLKLQGKADIQERELVRLEKGLQKKATFAEKGKEGNRNRLNKLKRIVIKSQTEFNQLEGKDDSSHIRRTKLLKREMRTGQKIIQEIDRLIADTQKLIDAKNTKRLKGIYDRQDNIKDIESHLSDLNDLKRDYTQTILNISFRDSKAHLSSTGEIYSFRDIDVDEKLASIGLSEANIEGYTNALIKEQEQGMRGLLSKEGSKALGVLKKKKAIPKEIRDLFGEYTDVESNYINSVQNIANIITNHGFLTDIKEMGEGKYFFDKPIVNEQGDFSKKIAADTNQAYSPLNGLYTSQEIYDELVDINTPAQLNVLVRTLMKATAFSKISKTVLSESGQVRNFVSNVTIAIANGNFDIRNLKKAGSVTWSNLTTNLKNRDYQLHIIKLGLVDENVNVNVLQDIAKDYEESAGSIESFVANLKPAKYLKKKLDYAGKVYQAGDNFWKVYNFENEKQKLKESYPEWTEEEVDQKAASIVRETTPTYSMISRAVRATRRFPFAGDFVSFSSEVLRNQVMIIKTIKEELSDPKRRKWGIKRALGYTAAHSIPVAASMVSRMALGISDEEDEAVSTLGAPWNRNALRLYTGFDKKKGEYDSFSLAYFDSYGYLKAPIKALLKGGDPTDKIVDSMKELLSPYFSEAMVSGAIIDVLRNSDQRGYKVYNEFSPASQQAEDIAKHLFKRVEPGTVTQVRRFTRSLTDPEGEKGRVYKTKDELLSFAGLRAIHVKADTSLKYRARDFKRNSFTSKYVGGKQELAVKEATYKNFVKELSKQVEAAKTLGLSNTDVKKVLKEARISRSTINNIVNGKLDKEMKSFKRKLK